METFKKLPVLTDSWPVILNSLFNRDSFKEGNMDFFDQNNAMIPAVNIRESETAFSVEMLAPGFSKEDFSIQADKKSLTIKAAKKTASENDLPNYTRREFSFESISRSFTIPDHIVDADNISAQYTNGILELSIPKKEEALPKPAKVIEVM